MASVSAATGNGRPTRGEKLSMLVRSFFIQSVWNPRGMQNVGFCFAMLPLLDREASEERSSFLKRHLGFFNTNPALATYVLGAAAAAEARGEAPGKIDELKRGLSSPLGMAGDALLWGALRPFGALVAVALAAQGVLWAPVALLVIYNVPHLALRWRGIEAATRLGPAAAREVLGGGMRTVVGTVRVLAAFVGGFIVALAVRGGASVEPWKCVVAVVFFALAYAAIRLRTPFTVIAAGGAVGGLVLLLAGLNGG